MKKDKGNIFLSLSLPQFGLLAILSPPAWLGLLAQFPRGPLALPSSLPGPAQLGQATVDAPSSFSHPRQPSR